MKHNDSFAVYNKRKPLVYELFKTMATVQCEQGNKTGSKAIIERIRWEYGIKIKNTYTPYYSRLFVKEFPQYKQFFKFRQIK